MPAGEDNNQQHKAEEPNPPPEPEELEQPNLPPNQPNQPNQPPNQVQNLQVAMAHPQQLNWSYFKPEFSGKPEEDAENTFSGPMTGWKHITSQMFKRQEDFA